MGYYRAGFDVVGVDIKPQPHYPFEFHQADALTYPLDGFNAYHASPPCQKWATGFNPHRGKYPDLIDTIRERFIDTAKPWVIENVPKAPIRADFALTGDMFGLPIKRMRHFETNWWNGLVLSGKHERTQPTITVTGSGTPTGTYLLYGRALKMFEFKAAMGIDWMNRHELSEAIPPAYTEYIGKYLLGKI